VKNTYTITTDDASYAMAVITILNCLQNEDVTTSDDLEAILHLLSMCLDNHLDIESVDVERIATMFRHQIDNCLVTQEPQS
jgi:hypothetical protein